MKKKRIMIPIGGYFPSTDSGGPAVSMENFCELLGEELDCYILTNTREMPEAARKKGVTENWTIRGKSHVYYLQMKHLRTKYMEAVIRGVKPDIIYLQSFFNACFTIPCLRIAKKYKIKVILAPRGELYKEALDKKYKKIPYILCLRALGLLKDVSYHATSNEEKQFIMHWLGVDSGKINVIRNVPSFHVNKTKREKESGKIKLVYMARICRHKNLDVALKCLRNIKGNVEYHLYGIMEDESYWDACKKIIQTLPENITVTYHGNAEHSEVPKILKHYHGFFMPTKHENFGHAIVEAMLNSCPVIISDQTPWQDLNKKGVGWVCNLYQEQEFVQAVQEFTDMDQKRYDELINRLQDYAGNLFDIEKIKQEYMEFMNKVTE